jgi:hypothetical protein
MTRNDDEITRDDPASVRVRRECRLWLCPRKHRATKRAAIALHAIAAPTVRVPIPERGTSNVQSTMPRKRVNLSRH